MSTTRRCQPEFPAQGVVLDASAIARFLNVGALEVLAGTVSLHVAAHVRNDVRRLGPAERTLLDALAPTVHPVRPGLATWDHFSRIRGARFSTRDLGEDESIAVCLAERDEGRLLPFVTYDGRAAASAIAHGIVAMDFLDTLAWLVACGAIDPARGDAIERSAGPLDGWKRPRGYDGVIEAIVPDRQRRLLEAIAPRR